MKFRAITCILMVIAITLIQFCEKPDDTTEDGAFSGSFPKPKVELEFDFYPGLSQTANVNVTFWFTSPTLDSLEFYGVDSLKMVSSYGIEEGGGFSYERGDILWNDQISIFDTASFTVPITPDTVGIQRFEIKLYSEQLADSSMHHNYWGYIFTPVYQRMMVQTDSGYAVDGY